jgi:hypothetical protein
MEDLTEEYVALPKEMMVNVLLTLDLCVEALQMMDPQNAEQLELKDAALTSAYALIDQHNELH